MGQLANGGFAVLGNTGLAATDGYPRYHGLGDILTLRVLGGVIGDEGRIGHLCFNPRFVLGQQRIQRGMGRLVPELLLEYAIGDVILGNSAFVDQDDVVAAGSHSYTKIVGKDDYDYGYRLLRMTSEQRWRFSTLLQPIWYVLLAVLFQWRVAIQDLELGRWFKGRMRKGELAERAAPFLRKARGSLYKDYVLFPVIGFWNWPRIVLGNAPANLIRTLRTIAIIFRGHFTLDA